MPGISFKEKIDKIEEESDYHLPMGSLPRLFRNSEKDFEKTVKGYLKADPKRVELLRDELNVRGKKVIGISWKSINSLNHLKKSLTLMDLAKVFKDLDVVLLNLQYGDVDKEIREFKKETGIEVLQCSSVDNREDLDGLAALIEVCDLVVSTSNVTIHLAGALAKETWVLLPYVANFWWLLDRSDSIWYPSLKLYRQKKFKDWDFAFNDLNKNLKVRFV
jgi:ADP-heptose:LPS heptosyltransferase